MGTIHTLAGLRLAGNVKLDAVEVRVDMLPRPLTAKDLSHIGLPKLITVRRKDEGGALELSDTLREELYEELLPVAGAIDLEMRSGRALRGVVDQAKRAGVPVVMSFHDFSRTPELKKLCDVVKKARGLGADVVKIAAKTESAGDVARLLALLDESEGPVSVMGMGRLGRASRLLFAKAGSVLNYGWLHQPQVPGQWGALEFRDLLGKA